MFYHYFHKVDGKLATILRHPSTARTVTDGGGGICKLISEVPRTIHEDGQQASQYEGASQRIPANSAHPYVAGLSEVCRQYI